MNEPSIYTWDTLRDLVLIAFVGLALGIFTKLGRRDANDLGYVLRRGGKIMGWVVGVGALVGAIRLLLILLYQGR
jgi:hypothetical protein